MGAKLLACLQVHFDILEPSKPSPAATATAPLAPERALETQHSPYVVVHSHAELWQTAVYRPSYALQASGVTSFLRQAASCLHAVLQNTGIQEC